MLNKYINQIICGDCLEVMRGIPDKSIDLVLTDPPYNISKAEWDKWKRKEDYIEWMGQIFKECERLLKDNGSFYFFHNDMMQMAQLIEWLRQNTELIFKSMITIDKTDNSFVKDLYGKQEHFRNYLNLAEYCLYYTFQDETGLERISGRRDCFANIKKYLDDELDASGYTEQTIKEVLHTKMASHYFGFSKRDKTQFSLPTMEQYKKLQTTGFFRREYEELRREYESLRYTFNEKKGRKNVWEYSFREDKKVNHPTQKPIRLIEDIIKASSNKGDIILDPFLGSGTTAIAAHNTGRFFVGIEKEPQYVEIARQRVEQAQAHWHYSQKRAEKSSIDF